MTLDIGFGITLLVFVGFLEGPKTHGHFWVMLFRVVYGSWGGIKGWVKTIINTFTCCLTRPWAVGPANYFVYASSKLEQYFLPNTIKKV